LVGGGLFLAGLLLEVFEPGTVVFASWVFGLPLLIGAVLGARGWRPVRAAGPFVVAYLMDLVHNWVTTGGDRVFHLVLAVLTGGLAALAATAARGARRHLPRRAA
jgi:hypothetical protein